MDKDRILSILPYDYEYIIAGDYKYKNEQDFRCTLNIRKIHNEEDAKKWIAKLSDCTLTTWRVQRTYPASGRCNVYKIAMKCQHNVNYKFKAAQERKKSHISKHTGCPSNLVLTIKRYVKKSKAKRSRGSDPSLIEWPCFVELKFVHNHPLNTAEVLRFRPLGAEIKEKIILLFKKGHTAASALESIKLELFLDNDDKYFEIAADRFYVPTLSQVQYLFNHTFGVTGSKDINCVKPGVEELINNYNSSTAVGRAEMGRMGDSKFVTICSPIMSRAHELLPHSYQIAMMEASGSTDKKGHKIYFIVSPTPAGSIPLGCIITDTDRQEVLNAALLTLKRCFPPDKSFFGNGFPCILMTDDDLKEQGPLKLHWPKSVMLLCQYRVLKAAWNWLNCNHNVPKTLREEVYYSIKRLIYCPNEKELCELYTILVTKYHSNLPKFVTYLNNMWPNRPLWSSAYRNNVPIGGNCDLNYVEITFKIMKDCILERIKNYNLTQLVDFILVHYEAYIRRRLLDFADGRVCKSLLYKYMPPTCIINPSTIIHSEVDSSCYFVPSESDYGIKYMVDVRHCICSCEHGRVGRVCKHLCGVINQIENPEDVLQIPQDFKDMLYRIATGNDPNIPEEEPSPEPPTSPFEDCINIKTDIESLTEKPILELTEKETVELDTFFNSITDGLKTKNDLFVPAVKAMLKTFSKMKSESAFLSALHTFGKHSNSRANHIIKSEDKKFSINGKRRNRRAGTIDKQYVAILPRIKINEDPLGDPLAV